MAREDVRPYGIRIPGSSGVVTTTGGATRDLLHTNPVVTQQQISFTYPAIVRKIMWYNNTGGNATIQIVAQSATPATVVRLPTIVCINTFDGELREEDIPTVYFQSSTVQELAAARLDGNIYVVGSVAGILVAIEVEQFQA